MTNPVFPTLSTTQDSALYSVELEDQSIKTPLDGGYVASRPRHTRLPRKTFKTGYTMLTETDKQTLEQFYGAMKGGSVIFDWTDTSTNTTYSVRFADKLSWKYTGKGNYKRWDIQLTLQQV